MQRRTIATALFLTLILMLSSIAYASGGLWSDKFSVDSIRTSGAYSYDYWLNDKTPSSDNVSASYSVSNGILTITLAKTGSISEAQAYAFNRLINITDDAECSIKFYVESAFGDKYFRYLTSNSSDDLAIGFNININNKFYVSYKNTSLTVESTELATLTANEWYIFNIRWTHLPNTYNVTLSYGNGTEISSVEITDAVYLLSETYKVNLEWAVTSGANNLCSRFYVDYITHTLEGADTESIINAFVPLIISVAMLSVALSFIKKVSR